MGIETNWLEGLRMVSVPSLKVTCTPYTDFVSIECSNSLEGLSARFENGVSTFQALVVLFDFLASNNQTTMESYALYASSYTLREFRSSPPFEK